MYYFPVLLSYFIIVSNNVSEIIFQHFFGFLPVLKLFYSDFDFLLLNIRKRDEIYRSYFICIVDVFLYKSLILLTFLFIKYIVEFWHFSEAPGVNFSVEGGEISFFHHWNHKILNLTLLWDMSLLYAKDTPLASSSKLNIVHNNILLF